MFDFSVVNVILSRIERGTTVSISLVMEAREQIKIAEEKLKCINNLKICSNAFVK